MHACSKDGRPEIYLKREDLNHTGAHKINNSLGQALLCRRMGKKRVIAETGAGQHGVATVSWLQRTACWLTSMHAGFGLANLAPKCLLQLYIAFISVHISFCVCAQSIR